MDELCEVFVSTQHTRGAINGKFWPQEDRWNCAAHHMEVHEPIVAHAKANIATLEVTFHGIRFSARRRSLQIIPRLRFSTILARVGAALICASQEVEQHYIHSRAAETCQFDVVGYDKPII